MGVSFLSLSVLYWSFLWWMNCDFVLVNHFYNTSAFRDPLECGFSSSGFHFFFSISPSSSSLFTLPVFHHSLSSLLYDLSRLIHPSIHRALESPSHWSFLAYLYLRRQGSILLQTLGRRSRDMRRDTHPNGLNISVLRLLQQLLPFFFCR